LYPLKAFAGYGRRGHPIYRVTGWSRANQQYPSLESAVPDHPEVATQARRGDTEARVGLWMSGSGGFGMIVGAAMAGLSSGGSLGPGSEPTWAIGIAHLGLASIVTAVGISMGIDGELRPQRALDEFNRQAEAKGCSPAPLP
jgi:hypothetical protein